MIILGIETSCDETAAAVLGQKNGRIQILSNVVASSASLQSKYGGIIPEQAAREQIKSIISVIKEALSQAFPNVVPAQAGIQKKESTWIPDQVRDDKERILPIDAIAVTEGPGLIGSLLVGVETAKVLSRVWNKPLILVNHLIGHFYANWISLVIPSEARNLKNKLEIATSPSAPRNDKFEIPKFPCIGLLVSGGHTDLVLFKNHGKYEYLGGTRDDAAGECFDKCARLLGLPYPGGPEIGKLAKGGKDTFKLPRPMINSDDFDFSFSGLKTAVSNLIRTRGDSERGAIKSPQRVKRARTAGPHRRWGGIPSWQDPERIKNLCAGIESAIIDVLVKKTVKAAKKNNIEQIIVAGGVAANQKLVSDLKIEIRKLKLEIQVFVPPPNLCTDNGAMIASAAFFIKPIKNPLNLQANPNLSLAY